MDVRSHIFSALTGKKADVSGKSDGDLRGMLMAIGGASSKTKSGIDLTRAAAQLKVSRRTVERWVKTAQTGEGQRPSAAHAKTLTTKARQSATTKAGRRAALKRSSVRRALTSRGGIITIDGRQGPVSRDYMRSRAVTLDLDPDQAAAMMDAFEEGGEKGFMDWARSHWDEEYVADWMFGSDEGPSEGDINSIDVSPFGGGWR